MTQARDDENLAESCEHDPHAFRHRALSRRRPHPGGLTLRTGALGRSRTRIDPFRRRAPLHSSHESECTTKMDASAGADPAHGRFAGGRVPVSPRRRVGSPYPNRTDVIRVRAGCFATKLRGDELVRVRCSAHRPPRSKRGTLLARASPWHSVFRRSVERFAAENASTLELARTRGVEPLPSGSVIRRILQFCYVRIGRASGYRSRST